LEFLWSKFPGRTGKDRAANNDASPEKDLDRRQALYALSAVAGGALSDKAHTSAGLKKIKATVKSCCFFSFKCF